MSKPASKSVKIQKTFGATGSPSGFWARFMGKRTIEDRFVPRDDGCLMAQGHIEWRQHKNECHCERSAAIFLIFHP